MSGYGDENEYDMEWPDDGQQDDGWGDDCDQNQDNNPRVDIENMYYEGDGNTKDSPKDAIEQFENVVLMEEKEGDEINYRFKAMEHIVVLSARLGLIDKMKQYQARILKIMDKVARNDVSEAISNILDAVSKFMNNNLEEQ